MLKFCKCFILTKKNLIVEILGIYEAFVCNFVISSKQCILFTF